MRKIAILCATAIATTMITPFAASAASPVDNATGTLLWDFEDASQVAPPPVAKGNWGGAVPEATYWGSFNDEIESGGWSAMMPSNADYSFPSIITGIDNIYAKSDGDAGWNKALDLYPKDLPAEKKKVFTDDEKAGKGSSVLAALSSNNKPMRVVGSCIKLQDTKIIPGQKYKFSCDAYTSLPRYGSGKVDELYLYAGFGIPSARETASIVRGGSEQDPYAFDAHPKAKNEKSPENAKKIGKVVDETWQYFESAEPLAAKASDFENGEVILYVGVAKYDAGLGAYPAGGTKLFLDNIKLVPVDDEGNPVNEIVRNQYSVGGTWDFETGTDDWIAIKDGDANRYCSHDDVSAVDEKAKANSVSYISGNPAQDSKKCLGINKRNDDVIAGIKHYINKAQFPAGDYTLKFTVTVPSDVKKIAEKLWVAVYNGKKSINNNNNESTVHIKAQDALSAAVVSTELQRISSWWSTITCNIKLTDACFDEEGYATLALLTGRIWGIWSPSDGEFYDGDARTYFDDISLTMAADDSVEADHQLVDTIIVYGPEAKSVLAISGAFDALNMDGTNRLYAAGTANADNVLGKKTISMNVPEGGITDAGSLPYFRIFTWTSSTLKPLQNVINYGMGSVLLEN